jgi:hypothetical protein
MDIGKIFEDAKKDPELLANIDINELLNAIESEKTDYFENKTLKSISDEVYTAISQLDCSPEVVQSYCQKLVGYRLVNELYELHKGKSVKIIKIYDDKNPETKPEPRLQYYGKVCSLRFLDHGTNIVCISFPIRYSQYKFDHYLTFQQLSEEEQLILMAYEKIEESEKN